MSSWVTARGDWGSCEWGVVSGANSTHLPRAQTFLEGLSLNSSNSYGVDDVFHGAAA